MTADKAQVRMVVRGQVQGVGFRYAAMQEARGLGLTGWVRNLPGGRVEMLAEGWRKSLDLLVAWAHQGPAAAAVGKVEVEWSDYEGKLQGFEVR
jgi:acylphosphatase